MYISPNCLFDKFPLPQLGRKLRQILWNAEKPGTGWLNMLLWPTAWFSGNNFKRIQKQLLFSSPRQSRESSDLLELCWPATRCHGRRGTVHLGLSSIQGASSWALSKELLASSKSPRRLISNSAKVSGIFLSLATWVTCVLLSYLALPEHA